MKILVYNDSIAFLMRTVNSSEVTSKLVTVHLLPLKPYGAAFLKQALSLVRTVNCLQWAVHINVFLHLSPLNYPSTSVLTVKLKLRTVLLNMIFHVVKR